MLSHLTLYVFTFYALRFTSYVLRIVPPMLASILIATLVVTALAAVLAVLLVIADATLSNYGPCTLTINSDKELTVEGGDALLATLLSHDIFIPSSCGGRGSCALCKVKVLDGAGPVLPTEEPHLAPQEIEDRVRLSCQIKVRNDLVLEIPEELLSVRRFRGTVDKLVDLTHDIKLLRIKLIEPNTIDFEAGQYAQLETPAYGDNPDPVYRAYSIASPPSLTDSIELCIRLVPGGICTTWVHTALQEGDEVYFNGPYGEFHLTDTDRGVVFVAGGSGLAPIRSILMDMIEKGIDRQAAFYFGAVNEKDLYYVDEMRALEQKLPRFKFVPALSGEDIDGWDGERGLITDVLDRLEPDLQDKEAYLCGSPGMIDACVKVMTGHGLPEDRIFYDKFA